MEHPKFQCGRACPNEESASSQLLRKTEVVTQKRLREPAQEVVSSCPLHGAILKGRLSLKKQKGLVGHRPVNPMKLIKVVPGAHNL